MKWVVLLGLVALLSYAAGASGWEKLDSVHFNSAHLDFGMVPRRGLAWYEQTDRPTGPNGATENGNNQLAQFELSHIGDESMRLWKLKLNKLLFHRISIAEARGDWSDERQVLEERARRVGWTGEVRDRIEVLGAFQSLSRKTQKTTVAKLRTYLSALAALEEGQRARAEQIFTQIAGEPAAGFLAEHARYQLASVKYAARDYASAVAEYESLLKRHPKGRKTEAALIMIGRCSIIPAKSLADAAAGSAAIHRLLTEFPHSRFRNKAIGLAGRVHYLAGRLSQAAWCYLRVGDLASVSEVKSHMAPATTGPLRVQLFAAYLKKLAAARAHYVFSHCIYGLDRLTKELTGSDGFRLNVILANDPAIASSYLYYRLYHCENTPRQLNNLARLGEKIARMHSWRLLSPGVRLRLAELLYAHREYRQALEWANRAGAQGDWDRALFVKGAALHKLHQLDPAIHQFQMITSKYPSSALLHGAREELALLYEEKSNLTAALRQYFRLGYKGDVAYIIDVRMSIPELEAYYHTQATASHTAWNLHHRWEEDEGARFPTYPERDLIAYSLGIRYMRLEEWRDAAAWLRRVPRSAYIAFSKGRHNYEDQSPEPLTAIRELSRLQRLARSASSTDQKAEAEYRYASYYYKHSDLLLYNYALWQHDRMMDLNYFWNPTSAGAADERAVRDHMHEHEAYAHALVLCKRIAEKYPKSPAAAKALYRAACSANHLSNFNPWWRGDEAWARNKKTGTRMTREAAHLMMEIVRRYPRDPLAAPARKYAAVFALYESRQRELYGRRVSSRVSILGESVAN